MAEITFRLIDQWPEDTRLEGKWSRFQASYQDTLELLDRELRHLNAKHVVIQLAIRDDQIRLDGLPRSGATPEHPGVILAFDSAYGPLKYASGAFRGWKDNLRAIALGLESLRRVDRYGITKRGEQYTGWRALPSGSQAEYVFHDDHLAALAEKDREIEVLKGALEIQTRLAIDTDNEWRSRIEKLVYSEAAPPIAPSPEHETQAHRLYRGLLALLNPEGEK